MTLLFSFFICAVAMFAASLDGKWTGALDNGGGREVVFRLETDGSKVTGSMSGPNGEARPITEGSLAGDKIALTVASEWDGAPVKLLVKGKVDGETMRVTIATESGEWSSDATLKKATQ